jgi:hypothetical protein
MSAIVSCGGGFTRRRLSNVYCCFELALTFVTVTRPFVERTCTFPCVVTLAFSPRAITGDAVVVGETADDAVVVAVVVPVVVVAVVVVAVVGVTLLAAAVGVTVVVPPTVGVTVLAAAVGVTLSKFCGNTGAAAVPPKTSEPLVTAGVAGEFRVVLTVTG